jgi:uncharacterized protein
VVFIWGSGWGPRRRRPRGYGWGPPPPRYGYGRRYGPGYGYGYGRGNGSCLRDLLLLNTGCCLAEAIGCGGDAFLLAPTTLRHVARAGAGGGPVAQRLVAAVRVYQREVSPKLPPGVCRYEPTCSHYAVEAIETHGARRGTWLTVRRLLRCRPGAARGVDPVPA